MPTPIYISFDEVIVPEQKTQREEHDAELVFNDLTSVTVKVEYLSNFSYDKTQKRFVKKIKTLKNIDISLIRNDSADFESDIKEGTKLPMLHYYIHNVANPEEILPGLWEWSIPFGIDADLIFACIMQMIQPCIGI